MRDIAIVGMGCRFPGANDLDSYWNLLKSGARQFHSVPASRWDNTPYFDPDDKRSSGKSYTDQVAYLDPIDQFDAVHYRMSPRRVRSMDPQHRLLLDVSREAIQDAGWERRPYDKVNTGVYFALSTADFVQLTPGVMGMEPYSVPGSLLNMAAATVSQYYDLGGPSFTLDSACSSGLTALGEAVTALRAGICNEALVGGAYLNLIPVSLVGFSRVGALSSAGVCRPFDKRADGFVLSEGVGAVVLRPLDDALAAGDRVYAVVRGVGCSNDGTTDGPMTPREDGQVRAMVRAYRDADVPANSVGLIEAHGTATIVGDRVELSSLKSVRAADDTDARSGGVERCYLSSVKSQIGHSLTASGLASLIKTALALHHRQIPPQPATDVEESLGLADAGLQLPETLTPWHAEGGTPRRAGINSFGFGGTNVHVVMEEAPPVTRAPEPATPTPELFVFSAGTMDLLREHLTRFLRLSAEDPTMSLTGLATTLASRNLLRARLAVVADSWDELRTRIGTALPLLAEGRTGALGEGCYAVGRAVRAGDRAVALVYPGQGSQRPGMLLDLYERYPAFRRRADELDDVVGSSQGFSALRAVYGDTAATTEGQQRLTGTDVCQPTLGVLELAATRLVEACGVLPTVTLGHSVGEFPAAAAAGVISDAETVLMMAERGAAMRAAEADRRGGMMAVQVGADRIDALATGIAGIWPACYNHPRQTVVAGTTAALEEFQARCAEQQISTHVLAVSNAFHTPLLDGVRERVRETVTSRTLTRPERTFVSCVGGDANDDPAALREYWERHASSPVRFAQAAVAAYEAGARIFVQVAGGQALLATLRHNLADAEGCHYVALSGDEPDDGRSFLNGLAQLTALGVDVDATPLTGRRGALLDLPVSPLANRSYPLPPWPDVDQLLDRPTAEPVVVGSIEPQITSTAPSRVQEDQPVSEIVNLFRDQIALLRSLDPSGMRSAGATPTASAPVPPSVPHNTVPAGPAEPAATPVAVPAIVPAPIGTPTLTPPTDNRFNEIRDVVYGQVARISAFPVSQFTGTELLVQELGFDSLMVTELLTALARSWPQLKSSAAELPKRPTLAEMVTAIAEVLGVQAPAPQPSGAVLGGLPPAAAAAPTASEPAPEPAPGPRHAMPAEIDGTVRPENGLAELAEVVEHDAALAELGRNPYFLTHEANIKDTTRVAGRELICFSSYNYLGLSGHPRVNEEVIAAVTRYGTSVSASRFLSGNRPLHDELESGLSALLGTDDALVMVSGHATNVSVIGHLVGPGDLIVHDELAHDSIMQGCALSGATRRPFTHNDPAALDAVLTRHRRSHRRCLIVVEGAYSMDGDLADVPALIEVKQRHGALLMIDEAHSIGVVGEHGGGVGEYFDVDRSAVDLWSGTMSKALASCGGYVAGNRTLIDYLKYTVPGFVYSVGITPANTAATLGALKVMRDEPERISRLAANSRLFLRLAQQAGVNTGTSKDSPVIPCIVGDSQRTLALSHALFDRGVSVNPIMYPGVPDELARLRFFVTSEHTPEQIERTIQILAEELSRLGVPATLLAPAPA